MPWYEYSLTPSGVSLPYVEIRLWHGARSVRLLALVDSGADSSLIDAQYAGVLGLDRADAQTSQAIGAGGSGITTLRWPAAPVEIQFSTRRMPFAGSFVEFPAGSDGVSLMGRRDFFVGHMIQFWEDAEMFNIDTSPDNPDGSPDAIAGGST